MAEKGLKFLRYPVYRIIDPTVRLLVRMRVHPNAISLAGFVVTVVAGLFYHQDHVRTAGVFVLLRTGRFFRAGDPTIASTCSTKRRAAS